MFKKLVTRFFRSLPLHPVNTDKSIHLLSADEFRAIRRLEIRAILISAGIGALLVLVLYIPQYTWPAFFAETNFQIFGFAFSLSITALIWGIFLVFVEIAMLSVLHLYCAHETAVAIGLIRNDEQKTGPDAQALIDIGLERKDKSMLRFGIDPYQGLSRSTVFLLNLFIALKATLSNVVMKLLMRRLLGRYALREVLDMIGIPVFAFWNGWATHIVLRETRVNIMGRHALLAIEQQLIRSLDQEYHALVYDALQFVAICKRDYHRNHALLTQLLIQRFQILPQEKHLLSDDFPKRLANAPQHVADSCRLILVLGLMLDGKISLRERRRMDRFTDTGWLHCTDEELIRWCKQFKNGGGFQPLIDRFPQAFQQFERT